MDEEELEALRQREAKRRQQQASLEEKMAERKHAATLDRPIYMTKREREAAELEAKKEEEEIQQLMDEAERAQRQEYMQKVRDALREQRERERSNRSALPLPKKEEQPKTKEELDREKELQQIKNAYLGVRKKKKKVMKISEKFRFSFDWGAEEVCAPFCYSFLFVALLLVCRLLFPIPRASRLASQDTSTDLNPLYEKKHEALLLFGRGLRAGIDRREQLQKRDAILQDRYRDIPAPPPPPPPGEPDEVPPPPPDEEYFGDIPPPPPPPPGEETAETSAATDKQRLEEKLKMMNSKSWLDKMNDRCARDRRQSISTARPRFYLPLRAAAHSFFLDSWSFLQSVPKPALPVWGASIHVRPSAECSLALSSCAHLPCHCLCSTAFFFLKVGKLHESDVQPTYARIAPTLRACTCCREKRSPDRFTLCALHACRVRPFAR
eukprot:6201120-Pleurochrysis_carterae.AAC.3